MPIAHLPKQQPFKFYPFHDLFQILQVLLWQRVLRLRRLHLWREVLHNAGGNELLNILPRFLTFNYFNQRIVVSLLLFCSQIQRSHGDRSRLPWLVTFAGSEHFQLVGHGEVQFAIIGLKFLAIFFGNVFLLCGPRKMYFFYNFLNNLMLSNSFRICSA